MPPNVDLENAKMAVKNLLDYMEREKVISIQFEIFDLSDEQLSKLMAEDLAPYSPRMEITMVKGVARRKVTIFPPIAVAA